MGLHAGTRLGPYEIVAQIGAGGMGEVYRARDSRLDREVAIKVLPNLVAHDAESLTRFEREAKTLASLNHPHIAQIYGVEDSGAMRALVMELVEGPTLADRLAAGPLPIDEGVRIARQIAQALEAAHERGIVHRDVKPANIKITPGGTVKVLDFGLAKASAGEGARQDLTQSLTVGGTRPGMILGTPAYMSPEQARGKPLDKRTDVWAFGCVLYEMLTGRLAFGSETVSDTIAAVLGREPEWSPLPAATPASLRRLLARCLEKDVTRRLRDLGDAQSELDDAITVLKPAIALPHSPSRIYSRRIAWRVGAAGAAVAALAASLFLRWYWGLPPRQPEQTTSFKVVPLTTYPGIERTPSFSPDGNQLAFSWNGPTEENFDIYVKTIAAGPPLRLTSDPAEDMAPAWSPDGSSIAFLRSLGLGKFSVVLVPPLGGPEQRLSDVLIPNVNFQPGPYLSWLADSQWLVVTDRSAPEGPSALFITSVRTREKYQITFPPAGAVGDSCAAASPDGKAVAFCRNVSRASDVDIYVVGIGDDLKPQGEARRLTFDHKPIQGLAWTPDARDLVLTFESSVWKLSAFSSAGPSSNVPVRVNVEGGAVWPAVPRQSSRLAFSHPVGGDPDIWRLPLPEPHGKPGRPLRLIASTKTEFSQQYSPDGKRIAFESDRGGNLEIWVCESDGGNCSQLTWIGAAFTGVPSWSPDGRQIAFYSRVGETSQIFVIAADGGAPQRLTSDRWNNSYPRWSDDGQWIYFASNRTGTDQIWRMPSRGGAPTQVTRNGGFAASLSPDGRWVYYTRDAGLDTSLWRMPVGGGEESRVLESVTAFNYAVADDGVYFVAPSAQGVAIQFLSFTTNTTRALAQVGPCSFGFAVSPDRMWILYTQTNPEGSDLSLVENFR
jgi:serine/threonine protein kinase